MKKRIVQIMLSVTVASSLQAAAPKPFVDDFSDGNDEGWRRYDVLPALGVAPATFEVLNGAYRLTAPARAGVTSVANPARAGALFPTNIFSDFEVAADLVSFDPVSGMSVGVVARIRNIGLGRTDGYLFIYQSSQRRVYIGSARGEQAFLLAQQPITLDPTRRYRMVFTGAGEFLAGKVYDSANPTVAIVTLSARDTIHPDGLSGVFIFSGSPNSPATATFDNYEAQNGVTGAPELSIDPAPAIRLAAETHLSAAVQTWANAVGDFNKDGKPDVAAVSITTRRLHVFLGNGDGTFQPKLDTTLGTNPQYMGLADFNRDGNLDAAVGNGDNLVTVLLGKGDGTFLTNVINLAVAGSPGLVRTADINQDQNPDLVVGAGPSSTSVLLGQGDGTFKAKVDYEGSLERLADANGDGQLDMIIRLGLTISVRPGRADGTFGDFIPSQLPENLTTAFGGVATADFDGDGKLDAAITSAAAHAVLIFLGRGDGTFATGTTLSAPSGTFVESADLDGDGRPDLVVRSNSNLINARGQAWQRLTVFLNKGKGRFDAGTTIRGGGFLGPVAIAHLNGDQLPDILVSNSINFWVTVLLNEGPNAAHANRWDIALPAAAGFEIQSSTDPNGPWTAMADGSARVIHGPAKALQLDTSGSHKFFRLRKP